MSKTKEIKIDSDLRPAYYDDFRCIAQNCCDSCCNGWAVSFDEQDYSKLKKQMQNPKLAKLLENNLVLFQEDSPAAGYYAKMQMCENGNCPLLAESGLCNLQLEAGAEALPEVCRLFPRKEKYYYSGYHEKSLTLGCEAVLHLLWDHPEGIDFRVDPLPREKQASLTLTEPPEWIERFQDIRSLCIDILQNRALPLPNRILLLGMRLQELSREGTDVAAWLRKTELLLDSPELLTLAGRYEGMGENGISLYLGEQVRTLIDLSGSNGSLKRIAEAILPLFSTGDASVYQMDVQRFETIRAKFNDRYPEQAYFFENLAVSLFFYQQLPDVSSREDLWKSYVSFCKVYAFLHFLAVVSVEVEFPPVIGGPDIPKKPFAPGSREAMFHAVVMGSRALLHDSLQTERLQESFFKNESATLAHMAILLGF